MSILKSNNLLPLIKDEKELQDSSKTCNLLESTHCDCDDENLIEIVKSIINESPHLTSGNCIDVSNNSVNLRIGNGLKNDGHNNVSIDYGDLQLVSPSLLSTIIEYKNDGTTIMNTFTSNSLVVEAGCKIDVDSKFKYTLNNIYSPPTAITGDYGTTIPSDNTYSRSVVISKRSMDSTSSNLLLNVSFSRLKSGLNVVNNKVVAPSGSDITSASLSVNVKYPFLYGSTVNSSITQADINLFSQVLNDKNGSLTFSNVTSTGKYFYILLPFDCTITNIIMDGAAPILGAFTKSTINNITTKTGISVSMNVYRSNATGAFNNNSIRIDFRQ